MHGDTMRILGNIEAGQDHLCGEQKHLRRELGEIKAILENQRKNEVKEAEVKGENKTKKTLFYGSLGTAAIALISFLTQYIMKKLCP
jgi:hypothetical protein